LRGGADGGPASPRLPSVARCLKGRGQTPRLRVPCRPQAPEVRAEGRAGEAHLPPARDPAGAPLQPPDGEGLRRLGRAFSSRLASRAPPAAGGGGPPQGLPEPAGHSGPSRGLDPEPGFSALLFLSREVLGLELEGLHQVDRAKRPVRVPQVFSRSEVMTIL